VKRREFIVGLGIAGVLGPPGALGQDKKVIGLLDSRTPDALADRLNALRRGLSDAGYVEGRNLSVEYRWGDNKLDRLPGLAEDLVRFGVSAIVTSSHEAAFAAKAATTSIPIVFTTAVDPVRLGLVTSLPRPTGNLTGINFLNSELTAKRLDLLRQLLPNATRIAILVNPAFVTNTQTTKEDAGTAASALGLQLQFLHASTSGEIDAAFTSLPGHRPDAVFVDNLPFFSSRRIQIVHLASHHRVPAIYGQRQFAEAGGLVSYGADISDAWHQQGVYAGRILSGAKVAELPVVQASKFELVINAQTARILGITVPPTLLARADEVIE
jgi:putative ABC transport system substrate-binding protein